MFVTKEFEFASAHFLTKYHGKCERLHGHNYKLAVTVKGDIADNGMVVDFVLLKKVVKEHIIDRLDHYCLNDFMENPTAEVMIKWIWDELNPIDEKLQKYIDDPNFPQEIAQLLQDPKNAKLDDIPKVELHSLKIWETPTSFVEYFGETEKK